jgi:DnaK suppressor protein
MGLTAAQKRTLRRALQALVSDVSSKGIRRIAPNRTDDSKVGGDEDEQPLNEMLQANRLGQESRVWRHPGARTASLEKLDHAPGDAGTCEDCGEDIPWGRLKAMPFAELCVACQGKRDTPHHGPDPAGSDGLSMSDRPELTGRADAWSAADPDETTRAELQKLLASEDFAELEDRFAGTLEFGTAGCEEWWGRSEPDEPGGGAQRDGRAGRVPARHGSRRRPAAASSSHGTDGG